MTNEERDLLLADICSRIPYRLKVIVPYQDKHIIDIVDSVDSDGYITTTYSSYTYKVEEVVPYLIPISKMSGELYDNFRKTCINCTYDENAYTYGHDTYKYLIEHLVDYNGLITLGLAKDGIEANVYI